MSVSKKTSFFVVFGIFILFLVQQVTYRNDSTLDRGANIQAPPMRRLVEMDQAVSHLESLKNDFLISDITQEAPVIASGSKQAASFEPSNEDYGRELIHDHERSSYEGDKILGKERGDMQGKERDEMLGKERDEMLGKERDEMLGKERDEMLGKERNEMLGKEVRVEDVSGDHKVRHEIPSLGTEDSKIWEEQETRLKRISETCERLDINVERKLNRDVVFRVLMDDKYKVLFSYIPKNGCTTWTGVFRRLINTHSQTKQRNFKRLSNCKESEWKMKLENYKTVVFVRNPLVRFLSAYYSKLKSFGRTQGIWEKRYGEELVQMLRPDGAKLVAERKAFTGRGKSLPFLRITLEEWARYVLAKGHDIEMTGTSDHWLPQHKVAHLCQFSYDFVGKYENLAVEAPFFLHWLKIDEAVKFPPVHASKAINNLVEGYKNMPFELLTQIQQYYFKDFELFGYDANATIGVIRGDLNDTKYLI